MLKPSPSENNGKVPKHNYNPALGEETMTSCFQLGTFACFTLQVNHLKLETISLAWQHTYGKCTHLPSQSIVNVTASHERERQSKDQVP